ncbi:MAG: hypothetical protein GXX85_17600 [Ignavibacteria bacterium]|nr:hypothetical protein [Ignavibacteria bacterium]
MNIILTEKEKKQLDYLIKETEKITGAEIVLSVALRSDSYTEIPWKAFATGVSVSGLLFFLLNTLTDYWYSQVVVTSAIVLILITGIIFALSTVFFPVFAKLFLSSIRSEEEVKQYAESLFLSKKIFFTKNRNGILIHVSLFEKKIIIIPDSGLEKMLTESQIKNIISEMKSFLKNKKIFEAFEVSLKKLSEILAYKNSGGKPENELSDEIIQEKKK